MVVTRTGWIDPKTARVLVRALAFVKNTAGCSWHAVARYCRVSDGTIHKARRGEPISATYAKRLCKRLERLILLSMADAGLLD